MKILHVLAGDPASGANRGALALVALQREAGWEVEVLNLRHLEGPLQRLLALAQRRFNALLKRLARPWGYFNFFLPFPAPKLPFHRYDVLHLHWVAGQVSPALLRQGRGKWVITLRDEWFFTGGCHYALQCSGYEQGCQACPRVDGARARGALGRFLVRSSAMQKAASFRRLGAPVVTIGEALGEKAKGAAALKDQAVSTIPNFVPPMPWPGEGGASEAPRAYYLFVTTHLAVAHKGLDLLRRIDAPVKVVGAEDALPASLRAPSFEFLGPISERERLGALMHGAKAVLVPSRAEAFGKVVLEAFSVGTPVIALAVDEPARLVEDGRSGLLVQEATEGAFAEAVERMEGLPPERYAALRSGARVRYEVLSAAPAILEAYGRLYRSVSHG